MTDPSRDANTMRTRCEHSRSIIRSMNSIANIVLSFAALSICSVTRGSDLILNEWNCVGSTKWLGNPDIASPACPSPTGIGGADCATADDVFLGRRLGNGGDWMELVVTKDHSDIRGWRVQWIEAVALDSDGTDIWYGAGSVPQGEIIFTNAALWSDLRAGTIITISESTTAQGGLDTDLSFDPCLGDWWINVNCSNAKLLACNANVVDPTNPTYNDPMDIGNDGWAARIVNAAGAIMIDMVGEGQPSWSGSGVNSKECVRLEENAAQSTTPYSRYDDADTSSFGQANGWTDVVSLCKTYQDFSALRVPVLASLCTTCKPIMLNEYNAVIATGFLGGGTLAADAAGGQASDARFGRVMGNGGNWMEFVIVANGLDLRGATIRWQDKTDSGVVALSSAAFWSNLPSGLIVTFTESNAAQGGLNTDLAFNFAAGDQSANINSFDLALVSNTTSTKPLHVSGEFSVSNDKWSVEVRDALGGPLMEQQGEGAPHYFGGSVGVDDVCRLREDPGVRIDSASAFDDTANASTFGAPNTWMSCPSTIVLIQSFEALPAVACNWTPANPADINGDGAVSGPDLAAVLSAWGTNAQGADIDGDGVVGGSDLAAVLSGWTG